MGDESSGCLEGKALSNLRVVDLKLELEKRGLSKSGSKKELVKRLKQKLELEKLYEESSASGDTESKLQLDEATEQNEFVKQYLAEQQKIYARQLEVKRLIELKESGKHEDEDETEDSDAGNKDQDSDASEGANVTKNSCDSSTHAEGSEREPEESKLSSGENELSSHETRDSVPKSSTQGINAVNEQVDNHSETESSDPKKQMESKPESIIPYSLADIQLPESPKNLCSKTIPNPDCDQIVIEDSQNSTRSGCEEVEEKKTNGTTNEEADSNLMKGGSPMNDSEVPKQEIENSSQSAEPMEIETVQVKTNDLANAEDLKCEKNETNDKVEGKDIPNPKDDDLTDVKTEKKSTKEEDREEGEADSDSEDDKMKSKAPPLKRTSRKFSREASQESTQSESSSSADDSKSRSSTSDSSSSRESVPKRRSHSRSEEQGEEKHSDSRESSDRDHKPSAKTDKPIEEPNSQQTATRRIKIKRSTSIVPPAETEITEAKTPTKKEQDIESLQKPISSASPVEKEKKEAPKRHFKKIEIDKPSSDSKPVIEKKSPIATKDSIADREDKPSRKLIEAPAEGQPVKVTYRKLNVPFRKKEEDKSSVEKKRPWHSISSLSKTSVSISTDSLKSIIPDFKIVCSSPSIAEEEEKPITKPVAEPEPKRVAIQRNPYHYEAMEVDTNTGSHKERTVVDSTSQKKEATETQMEVDSDPAPRRTVLPEKPQSKILFIHNLVRPFTLLQLKEVLKRTGVLVEEGFWIDKIKSKCFVTYETEDQASETRQALHNCRWPASSPKILSVDFTTQEELDAHKMESDSLKPPQPAATEQPDKKPMHTMSDSSKRKEKIEKENRDHEKQRQTITYIREWDKDKLLQESPEREKDKRRSGRKRERSKSIEKQERKKETPKKPEEETPAKLLDDLFQKTKATPCIYWLPLTEEQVKQKEDERKQRRLEREKRNQEEEAERLARRKPRGKGSRSRSRSPAKRR